MSDLERRFDRRRVVAWSLVAFWAAVVWTLGTDNLSAAQTSRFLRPLIEFFYPDLSVQQLYRILVAVRKTAHVAEYALLAILTLRALLLGRRPSATICAALAFGFVVSFATADESRQAFSQARLGSVWDVALDSAGGAFAIGILLLLRRQMRDAPAPSSDPGGSSS